MDPLSTTIEIEVKTYHLDSHSEEYRALSEKLRARGLPQFEVWHTGQGKDLEAGTYHVETIPNLFADQVNTSEGWRVFDWYDGMTNHTRRDRIGHYIEDGPGYEALKLARANINACGYCGKQEPAARGTVFCSLCLDSPYLKETELHLLRMLPVAEKFPKRSPLSKAEQAHLWPLYREAQIHGNTERGKARIAKARADLLKKRDKAILTAKTEFEGFSWLMDRGVDTQNVIYYSHTDKFCFGWQTPVSAAAKSALLDIISEFPFAYEIKCEDGSKLEAA